MTRLLVQFICVSLALILPIVPMKAEGQTGTHVRVLDASGEAIGGIVLLVNPGETRRSHVFLTSRDGNAFLPDLGCEICTIAALDPRGIFFDRTSGFNGKSHSLILTLKLRPLIDTVGNPHAAWVEITVFGQNAILPHQKVIVRPADLTLTSNWVYAETTDSRGRIRAELSPGKYEVGTLINGGVWHASFSIKSRLSGRASKHPSISESKPKLSIMLHLLTAN